MTRGKKAEHNSVERFAFVFIIVTWQSTSYDLFHFYHRYAFIIARTSLPHTTFLANAALMNIEHEHLFDVSFPGVFSDKLASNTTTHITHNAPRHMKGGHE